MTNFASLMSFALVAFSCFARSNGLAVEQAAPEKREPVIESRGYGSVQTAGLTTKDVNGNPQFEMVFSIQVSDSFNGLMVWGSDQRGGEHSVLKRWTDPHGDYAHQIWLSYGDLSIELSMHHTPGTQNVVSYQVQNFRVKGVVQDFYGPVFVAFRSVLAKSDASADSASIMLRFCLMYLSLTGVLRAVSPARCTLCIFWTNLSRSYKMSKEK
ncbi:uncharacterized protein L969DRAFT_612779 [Mixia osmundae IAM 14324]|uniref:Uncharacterized protein n=1 Tax=Mixia osmundae (strain CBS 9802 / IAM 14324 / JCM 22182 / KY 12970) TaxID=764103 RepID=G7EB72_MIXOS|nr:uncharacterized protein L969DRAFT_612779 [Mixia osmundae IAM 14324]KEI36550.1 hypothetical protein L969DRAFT_612779 [Mixia osmundae IAM 14324]GAB00083.1 hypothetical protein E5Q_06785 [Mixia osmundae IAM 14324]